MTVTAPKYLTIREAAALVGVTRATVYEWINRSKGALPCVRPTPRTTRIEEGELKRWLKRQRA